jgi:tetratricopeptide (TPR) repeat protein
LYWHQQHSDWNKWVFEYVELRKTIRQPNSDQEKQDDAAISVYRELVKLHAKYDLPGCRRLADQIVDKSPQSLFCPAAVLSVGHILEQHHGGRSAIPIYEDYLGRLQQKAPARSLQFVKLALAHDCVGYSNPKTEMEKAVAIYREVAEHSNVTYEKRLYLLRAAQAAQRIGDAGSLAFSRRLYSDFIVTYPDAPEAAAARVGVLGTLTAAGDPKAALANLREMEREQPAGTDLSFELYEVAVGFREFDDRTTATDLLQEIIRRFPNGPRATAAWIGLAETYSAAGDELKMLDAYKQATGFDEKEVGRATTRTFEADRAFRFLGEYYTKKEDWSEALMWWKGWRPNTGCGTCNDSLEHRRAYNIALCQRNLGQFADAIATLEPLVLDEHEVQNTGVVHLLVDIYRQQGQLGILEQKLKKALSKSPRNATVKEALDYMTKKPSN